MRALRDAAVIGQRGETHSLTAAVLAVILTPPTSLPPRLDSANFARTPTPKRALRDAVVTGQGVDAHSIAAAAPATPLPPIFARGRRHRSARCATRSSLGAAASQVPSLQLRRHCGPSSRHTSTPARRGTAPSPANPRRLSRHCSRPRRHSNALDANESGAVCRGRAALTRGLGRAGSPPTSSARRGCRDALDEHRNLSTPTVPSALVPLSASPNPTLSGLKRDGIADSYFAQRGNS
jgi:hypothetical protein